MVAEGDRMTVGSIGEQFPQCSDRSGAHRRTESARKMTAITDKVSVICMASSHCHARAAVQLLSWVMDRTD